MVAACHLGQNSMADEAFDLLLLNLQEWALQTYASVTELLSRVATSAPQLTVAAAPLKGVLCFSLSLEVASLIVSHNYSPFSLMARLFSLFSFGLPSSKQH